jgi:Zn-dependent protease
MTYTTTTTAAPVWATTWAILPELPTATAEDISNEQQPRTATAWATICARFATLWAVLKDYAAGTWDSIQNRTAKAARKVAKVATSAALYLFRFVWFAGILAVTFFMIYVTAYALGHFDPLHNVTEWIRIPFGLICIGCTSIGAELLLILLTKRIDRATNCRLFDM